MAEDYRTGFIWENFMKTDEARRAMKLVGFRPSAATTTGNGGNPRIHTGKERFSAPSSPRHQAS